MKLMDLIARFEKLEETVVNNSGDLMAVTNILVIKSLDVHKFDVVGALSNIQFCMGQPVQVVEMTEVQ